MRVSYIKLQDVSLKHEIDFSELEKDILSLIEKYPGFNVEKGLYFVNTPDDADLGYTEMVIFSDDYFVNELKKHINKYLTIIEDVDITQDVKFGTCNKEFFINEFLSDNSSEFNITQLETFLSNYITTDDILDKITLLGIESVNENDKLILQS